MISAYFLEYAVLGFMLIGFAAIVCEIAVKDSSLFGQIARDVRRMAEPARLPAARSFTAREISFGELANSNEIRKAA